MLKTLTGKHVLLLRGDQDRVAVETVLATYTWHEVVQIASQLARKLEPATRVAIQLPNDPMIIPLMFAAWMRGQTPVLLHPRFPQQMVDEISCDVVWEQAVAPSFLRTAQGGLVKNQIIQTSQFASVVFTSGTRGGTPKGIAHTFEAHLTSAKGANQNIAFESGDRWLVSLPMCHVGGLSLLFRAMVGDGSLVFPAPGETLHDAIVRTRPSHLSLVPTQLRRLLKHENTRRVLENASSVLIGGGPVNDALFDLCTRHDIAIRQTYGMTETASQIATGKPGQNDCGHALEGREIRVENGTVFVRGDVLGSGVFVAGTLQPLVGSNGWLNTRDLGTFTESGALKIRGRADNMFVSGGENICPEQIETVLLQHFGEVIVVPIPDDDFGMCAFAFVDQETTIDRIRSMCEQALPKFMWPVKCGVLPELKTLKRSRLHLKELAPTL